MSLKFSALYSKRLGLPGYSSHQFSVSVETELVATGDLAGEVERLYQLLQSNVDEQIQTTGFVPGNTYGLEESPSVKSQANFNRAPRQPASWRCTEKQKGLIIRLVDEHQLSKEAVDAFAVERFGKGVKALNRLEASSLIDELLETQESNDFERCEKLRRQPPSDLGTEQKEAA